MDTMEGVYRVIRPWLCIFLCDQLLHFERGLESDSFSTSICVFASTSESLIVDRVYCLCDFPHSRVASFVRLVHSSYGRFDVDWDS